MTNSNKGERKIGYKYCRVEGCPNYAGAKGKSKITGETVYRNLCEWHRKNGLPLAKTYIPHDIPSKKIRKKKLFYKNKPNA